MAIDLETAKKIAFNAFVGTEGQYFRLEEVKELPGPVYNFNPRGWILFAVAGDRLFLGGTYYVAVHPVTGEARRLGRIGE